MVGGAWIEGVTLRKVAMLDLFKKSNVDYPVNPRFRAYGKARIDIAQRAVNREDWDRMWKRTTNPFPFSWAKTWKHCVEYKVKDFAAEVGFFIDFLGFPVNAFDPDYAMFTSPNGEFFFSIVPAQESEQSTPPDAIRLQFMIENIKETASELERRGIVFEQWPTPGSMGSELLIGIFRSPNGIRIELWGLDEEDKIQNIPDDIIEYNQLTKKSEYLSQQKEYETDQDFEEIEDVEIDLVIENEDKNDFQPKLITAPLFQLADQEDKQNYDPSKEVDEAENQEVENNSGDQSIDEEDFDEDDSPIIEYVVDEDY
jgi:catechol 2,3-dioxygenase-like lactoylglutathione lyase family enzyme